MKKREEEEEEEMDMENERKGAKGESPGVRDGMPGAPFSFSKGSVRERPLEFQRNRANPPFDSRGF